MARLQPLQGGNRQEVAIQEQQQRLAEAFRRFEALFNHLNDMGRRFWLIVHFLPSQDGLDAVLQIYE
ncbi:hypothetical protein [Paenibacillus donghaensis]|uniref:hypothetical protein n=1 Tax=Paenibacillus donghaensis TaxID=414771 RepID=UPI001FE888CE|nr:hypothetical protein [Paenibacillus donghaensis]